MKFYISYFKLRFITGLQYRAAALAGLSTQFFFGIIFAMVYIAFYESNDVNAPMQLTELVSYLWLNQVFFSLINMFYKDKEIINMIKSGNIAYELARPKRLYFMWFSKILGSRVSMVILRSLPILIIAFILPKPYNLSLPVSIDAFLMFLFTLIIGTLLMTSLITLYHVIVLNTLDEKGIANIFSAVADILSGVTVPIPFFPSFLKVVANILPFRYVSDLSFRIYSGNVSINEGLQGIIIQIIWIIITTLIGYLLTKKSLKRVVVQGG